ncbi:MAG: hypothetical protein Q9221_006510 [Calogaya cf. arnoldii]
MLDLREPGLKIGTEDGVTDTLTTKYTDEELGNLLAGFNVDIVHFPDDNGKKIDDTSTEAEISALSKPALDALHEAWIKLRNIMSRKENVLIKRWFNKKQSQKKDVLMKVRPQIPPVHRPDFEVLRLRDKRKKPSFAISDALQFPYLNLEDLSQPKTLMSMMDSRARNFPSLFANFDRESLRVGIKSKGLVPKYVRGYTMYLAGQSTRETYGRIVSWKEDIQALVACYTGRAPLPGMGLLIVETQRDILQFLVHCCSEILHDIDIVGLGVQEIKLQPRQQMVEKKALNSRGDGHDASVAFDLEAHYRAPDISDFIRLSSLVGAKFDEVADHFASIREDPAYLVELIEEACGHTSESVYNPHLTVPSENVWNEAISRVVMTAYHDVFTWEAILQLLYDMISLSRKEEVPVQLGQSVAGKYSEAFTLLSFCLDCVARTYVADLPCYMAAVPTFKKFAFTEMQENGKMSHILLDNPDDYLFWLFTVFDKDVSRHEEFCGLPNILQEIEKLITSKRVQKDRLSWRLIRLVSEVAVIAEIQRQMDLPTCTEFWMAALTKEELDSWKLRRMAPLDKIRVVSEEGLKLAPLIIELRKCKYPSEKPRTATTTAKMRIAEGALDRFWEELNLHFKRKTGKSLRELEGSHFRCRAIQRTPEWDCPKTCDEIDGVTDCIDPKLALAMLVERTESTTQELRPLTLPQKEKTRGLPVYQTTEQTLDALPETSVAISIAVKKKAFNTFKVLFGNPVDDQLPGELSWNDFKKALVAVGFGAEKVHGSAWLFTSDTGNIGFHEPHPDNKLPIQIARRDAKRLANHFHWTMETFVLDGVVGDGTTS